MYGKTEKKQLEYIIKLRILDKKSKITIAPIVNFRDFHTMSTDHIFDVKQIISENKVKLIIDKRADFPIYMNLSEGKYIKHENDIYKDMFYIEEEKRGFYPKENHSVTGVYEVEINPNEEKEISFVCGFEENIEEVELQNILKRETKRTEELIEKTELLKNVNDSKK